MTKIRRSGYVLGLAMIMMAVLFSAANPVLAATGVPGGEVSGTWTLAGSPYLIEGDITVPAGETLSIEPGVEVIFQSWYKLTVNGQLDAVGTEAEPILFTATNNWLGLRFVDAPDGSQLSHVIVERGQATGASPDNKGGGIYVENASPTISNSTIRDNTAKISGGGIYLVNSTSILNNNRIVNNTAGTSGASASGGGVYLTNSDVELIGNRISGNRVYISGSYSTPSGLGGGIYARSSSPTLRDNVISDNIVDANLNSNARGGGLYFAYSSPLLTGNTITGNAITNDSTGVYAVKEGGGIYLYWSSPTIVNSILWNNAPQEIFIKGSSSAAPLTAAYTDVQGGEGSIVNPDGAPINWAAGNMDSDPLFVDAAGGDYQVQADSPAVDAGTAYFELGGVVLLDLGPEEYVGAAPDMGALEYGGAPGGNQPPVAVIAADRLSGSAPLTVQFNSDGSFDPDGTILAATWDFGDGNQSAELNPVHTFQNIGSFSATLTVTDNDGATHSDVVTVNVVDGTTIEAGNVAGPWGLAGSPYRIDGDITVPVGETLTIEPGVAVIFQGWYKFTVNGRLDAAGSEADPILFTATDKWLGIRFVGAADGSQLRHAVVERGQATGASPEDKGGGIYVENASPIISDSRIRDNSAKSAGGGIYLTNSNAVLNNNHIVNNTAGTGGASAAGGGVYLANADVELTGNRISGNRVTISGSYTTPNGLGGGIYASSSSPTVRNNIISDNVVDANLNSNARGGGIYFAYGSPVLTGNTITGNAVTNDSTGIYAVKEGGGIYLYQSSPTIVNSILWNDAPQELFVKVSGPAVPLTVAYADVQGGEGSIVNADNAPINWVTGNIDGDPLFVDAVNGDHYLQANSPAIDAGTAIFEWDGVVLLELNPDEYLGSAPDMGALESEGSGGGVNLAPVAEAGPDQTVLKRTVAYLDGSASLDPDGEITSYQWQQVSGKEVSLKNAESAVASFDAPSVRRNRTRTLVFELTVVDDGGAAASDTVTVVVVGK